MTLRLISYVGIALLVLLGCMDQGGKVERKTVAHEHAAKQPGLNSGDATGVDCDKKKTGQGLTEIASDEVTSADHDHEEEVIGDDDFYAEDSAVESTGHDDEDHDHDEDQDKTSATSSDCTKTESEPEGHDHSHD